MLTTDHKPFLSDKFDVHAYANAVLAGQVYRPDDKAASEPKSLKDNAASGSGSSKQTSVEESSVVPASSSGGTTSGGGDVSVELAKLNYGIVRLS